MSRGSMKYLSLNALHNNRFSLQSWDKPEQVPYRPTMSDVSANYRNFLRKLLDQQKSLELETSNMDNLPLQWL